MTGREQDAPKPKSANLLPPELIGLGRRRLVVEKAREVLSFIYSDADLAPIDDAQVRTYFRRMPKQAWVNGEGVEDLTVHLGWLYDWMSSNKENGHRNHTGFAGILGQIVPIDGLLVSQQSPEIPDAVEESEKPETFDENSEGTQDTHGEVDSRESNAPEDDSADEEPTVRMAVWQSEASRRFWQDRSSKKPTIPKKRPPNFRKKAAKPLPEAKAIITEVIDGREFRVAQLPGFERPAPLPKGARTVTSDIFDS